MLWLHHGHGMRPELAQDILDVALDFLRGQQPLLVQVDQPVSLHANAPEKLFRQQNLDAVAAGINGNHMPGGRQGDPEQKRKFGRRGHVIFVSRPRKR